MSKILSCSPGGWLIYVMVCTRLNIVQAVGVVSKYMTNLRERGLEYCKVDYEILKRHERLENNV